MFRCQSKQREIKDGEKHKGASDASSGDGDGGGGGGGGDCCSGG